MPAKRNKLWEAEMIAGFQNGTFLYPFWVLDGRGNDQTRQHYAHPNPENRLEVRYFRSAKDGERGRFTVAKPGRYLTQFFYVPDARLGDRSTMPKPLIDAYVTRWRVDYSPPPVVQFARTADEIERVYTFGPSSCMSHPVDHFATDPLHPVRAYAGLDLSIAYLTVSADDDDAPDRIVARAVAWEDRKLYGRCYGDENKLARALMAQGFKQDFAFSGARMPAIELQPNTFLMPYLDNSGFSHRAHLLDGIFYLGGPGPEVPNRERAREFVCTNTAGYVGSPENSCCVCHRMVPLQPESVVANFTVLPAFPALRRPLSYVCRQCWDAGSFGPCSMCGELVGPDDRRVYFSKLVNGLHYTVVVCRLCRSAGETTHCDNCGTAALKDYALKNWFMVLGAPTASDARLRESYLAASKLSVWPACNYGQVCCPRCLKSSDDGGNFHYYRIQLDGGPWGEIFPCTFRLRDLTPRLTALFLGQALEIEPVYRADFLAERAAANDPRARPRTLRSLPRIASTCYAPGENYPSGISPSHNRLAQRLIREQRSAFVRRPERATKFGDPATFEEMRAAVRSHVVTHGSPVGYTLEAAERWITTVARCRRSRTLRP